MLKIRKHFITDNQTKVRVHYSFGKIINDARDCVTIYAKDCGKGLEKLFGNAQNNSDATIDYFENSKVRIFEDHPLYKEVLKYSK